MNETATDVANPKLVEFVVEHRFIDQIKTIVESICSNAGGKVREIFDARISDENFINTSVEKIETNIQTVQADISWDEVTNAVALSLADVVPEEHLDDLVDFLKSDLGKIYLDTTSKLNDVIGEVIDEFLTGVSESLQLEEQAQAVMQEAQDLGFYTPPQQQAGGMMAQMMGGNMPPELAAMMQNMQGGPPPRDDSIDVDHEETPPDGPALEQRLS